ncbi:hypothetical protein BC828DRAFT_403427 [Blastocladiella britannica]|nr:hypothetical protein BC828DRAFT_403427 [Blastocladiella britannica]
MALQLVVSLVMVGDLDLLALALDEARAAPAIWTLSGSNYRDLSIDFPGYLVYLALSEWNLQVLDLVLAAAKLDVLEMLSSDKYIVCNIIQKSLMQFSAARIIPGLTEQELEITQAVCKLLADMTLQGYFAYWDGRGGNYPFLVLAVAHGYPAAMDACFNSTRTSTLGARLLLVMARGQMRVAPAAEARVTELLESLDPAAASYQIDLALGVTGSFYAHTSVGLDTASALLKRLVHDHSALVGGLTGRPQNITDTSRETCRLVRRSGLSLAVLLAWSCPHPPDPALLAKLDDEHRGYTGSASQVCRQLLLLMLRTDLTGALVKDVLATIPPTSRSNIWKALWRNEWARLYELCVTAIHPSAPLLTKPPKRFIVALERLFLRGSQSSEAESTAFAMIMARHMHPVLVADLMCWYGGDPVARSVRRDHRDEAEMLLAVLPRDIRKSPEFVSMLARVGSVP